MFHFSCFFVVALRASRVDLIHIDTLTPASAGRSLYEGHKAFPCLQQRPYAPARVARRPEYIASSRAPSGAPSCRARACKACTAGNSAPTPSGRLFEYAVF
jgi:hypothetical protein